MSRTSSRLLWIVMLLTPVANSRAQAVRYQLAVQLNPVVHYSAAQVDGLPGSMRPFSLGFHSGAELNFPVTDRWVVTPTVKYYRSSQHLEQTDFAGYFRSDSRNYAAYTYENLDLGLLVKHQFPRNRLGAAQLIGGALYGRADNNELAWGSRYRGTDQSEQLLAVGYRFTPSDLGTDVRTWRAVLGARWVQPTPRLGTFELGALVYLPLNDMPPYAYEQILRTTDQGELYRRTDYTSRQYSAEISVLYHLLASGRKARRAGRIR